MFYFFPLILVGVLQGLTEFLPVSSSGHLVLFQYFSKELSEDLSLNVAVHLGTLMTIVLYYRHDILGLLLGVVRWNSESIKMISSILVASIPTAIIGLSMKKLGSWVLTSPLVAGWCLAVTGIILLSSSLAPKQKTSDSGFGLGIKGAFLVGLIQGFAVLPGISRSGSTIVGGLFLGMTPTNAARFSFLISLPAIAGAGVLEFSGMESQLEWQPFLIGGVVSFLTGLLAIHWMVRITQKVRYRPFAIYVLGLSTIFLLLYTMGLGANSL